MDEKSIEYRFICKCKKQSGWIRENSTTIPCPNCGRRYRGVWNKRELKVDAFEIKKVIYPHGSEPLTEVKALAGNDFNIGVLNARK